jgi:hypothetical protein
MFRSALVSFNALRKGRFVRLDGVKYIALPAHSPPKLSRSAERWAYNNGQWAIESAPVAEDNTHAEIDGRVFATYAVKFAVSDILIAAQFAATAPSVFFGQNVFLPLLLSSCAYSGYVWLVVRNSGDEMVKRQRSAISIAMGRDKYGYGPREF